MSEFDIGPIECPICGQEIQAGDPFWDQRDLQKERQKVIRELHNKGFSYRQIMKVVGLKSTRSISMALGRTGKPISHRAAATPQVVAKRERQRRGGKKATRSGVTCRRDGSDEYDLVEP